MRHATGPSRLILINSGKFDYGEVELGSPLHLIGPNNVGKTTLISTLQFLYVDSQKQMHFSRSLDETRRYYFPGQDSYVLFECLTPTGYMVVGVRGLGPLKGWEFRRFLYKGMYSRDDFIDNEGKVRGFDDIRRDLGVREYTELKPHDLMNALTGIGGGAGVNLGLVPVRNRNGYSKFKTIFRNLLRLAHLSQQELKTFLLDVNRSELRRTEIDLAGDFSPQYKRVLKSVRELADLRANAEIAVELLKRDDDRKKLRTELPEIRASLITASKLKQSELELELKDASTRLDALRVQDSELDQRKHDLMQSLNGIQRKIGVLEDRLERFQTSEERFAAYMHEFEESQIKNLDERITGIALLLKDAVREGADQVRDRLAGSERDLERRRNNLNNLSNSAAAHWGELPDKSDGIFRIINKDILFLPDGPGGLEVLNREGVSSRLKTIADGINSAVYADDSMRLNLDSLDPPDFKLLTDRKRLELSIAGLEATVERDRQTLEAIEQREQLRQQHHEQKKELSMKQRLHNEWEKFEEDRQHAGEWEEELSVHKTEESDISLELDEISATRHGLAEKESRLSGKIGICRNDLAELSEKTFGLPELPSQWVSEIRGVESELGLDELFRRFDRMYSREEHLSDRIADGLRGIESRTYGKYPASDEDGTLALLREDIAALDKKEEAVRKLWLGLATDLGQAFKALIQSFEILEGKVRELNRQLSGVSISDLKRLTLRISENRQWTTMIRRKMEADEMPLFSDRKAVEESLESLGELLEKTGSGRIHLLDMFNLSFEITTADGKSRTFTRLENIESHGTTITIKVLMNLMLLRGLIAGREVRIPFYLDEASSLDRDNLFSVVETAFGMGFPAILASPDAMDAAENLYFMRDISGRVHLDPEKSRIHLSRSYAPTVQEPEEYETG